MGNNNWLWIEAFSAIVKIRILILCLCVWCVYVKRESYIVFGLVLVQKARIGWFLSELRSALTFSLYSFLRVFDMHIIFGSWVGWERRQIEAKLIVLILLSLSLSYYYGML
jgi:hypothetical protein